MRLFLILNFFLLPVFQEYFVYNFTLTVSDFIKHLIFEMILTVYMKRNNTAMCEKKICDNFIAYNYQTIFVHKLRARYFERIVQELLPITAGSNIVKVIMQTQY